MQQYIATTGQRHLPVQRRCSINFYHFVCTSRIFRYVWLTAHLLLLQTLAAQGEQGRLSARHGIFEAQMQLHDLVMFNLRQRQWQADFTKEHRLQQCSTGRPDTKAHKRQTGVRATMWIWARPTSKQGQRYSQAKRAQAKPTSEVYTSDEPNTSDKADSAAPQNTLETNNELTHTVAPALESNKLQGDLQQSQASASRQLWSSAAGWWDPWSQPDPVPAVWIPAAAMIMREVWQHRATARWL
jgi:hypothetical protein